MNFCFDSDKFLLRKLQRNLDDWLIVHRNTTLVDFQLDVQNSNLFTHNTFMIGFGGLEVACWPLVPKFAGSNPAEAVGFLRVKKSSARLPSEGK